MSSQVAEQHFWRGKRVFITGNTGFKGSWMSLWLSSLGATVKGFSLKPTASRSLYEGMQLCSNIETTFGDVRDFSL